MPCTYSIYTDDGGAIGGQRLRTVCVVALLYKIPAAAADGYFFELVTAAAIFAHSHTVLYSLYLSDVSAAAGMWHAMRALHLDFVIFS